MINKKYQYGPFLSEELNNEIWKKHYRFEFYEGSNLGRVRSVDKYGRNGPSMNNIAFYKGKIISFSVSNSGHCTVGFWSDGKGTGYNLSRFIYECFFGKINSCLEVCHIDSNPLNNRIENLRLGTHKSNMEDMVKNGTSPFGEKHGMHKLHFCDISVIFDLYEKDFCTQKEIANRFGVSQQTISNIVNKKIWNKLSLETNNAL